MTISDPTTPTQSRRARHESFLVYDRFRFLKIACVVVGAAVLLYILDTPYGSRYGGSWAGYTLGTVGGLLILWLMWFGYRKRSYRENKTNLAGLLSAHVYLGLSLLVIATLHTGFHFGWNIHTLAYALMLLVIASGGFGVFCYARYPRLMTENRAGIAMPQLLGRIASLNDELRAAALGLDDRTALLVRNAVENTMIGGTLRQQLSGRDPNCTTAAALAAIGEPDAAAPELLSAVRRVRLLLDEKAQLLARARRDIRYKALIDFWLYLHVPLSFALLAALLAHVISVFYLW
jgi:uncharacterized membrane protein